MCWIIAIHATVTVAMAVATAGAQGGVPAKVLPGFQAIQQSDLRRDLTYLSSDELGGSMSLQPGDELAARWIAGQFAKAGRFDHESALNVFLRSDQFPFLLHNIRPSGGSPGFIPTITTPQTPSKRLISPR